MGLARRDERMPVNTTMLHVRVDGETKARAEAALDAMGLTVSEAVRVFLRRIAAEQAIPFAIKVPNLATRAAMEEARAMGARTRFATADELLDALAAGGR